MTRGAVAVAAFAVTALASGARQAPAASAMATLLDRYAQGDHGAADQSRLMSDTAAWMAFAANLETSAPAWIQAAPPSETDRRRRIVAAFALEVTSTVIDSPSRLVARRILGWVCAEVRRAPLDDSARAWWRASTVLLERAEDWDLLLGTGGDGELRDGHLAHVRAVLGDAPPLRLSAAVGEEGRSWRGAPANLQGMVRRLPGASRAAHLDAIAEHFSALTPAPAVGSEAALRLAITDLRRGQVDAAPFASVAQSSRDPFVLYVSRLVGGTIQLQQRRPSDAISSFREALTLVPRAQSAGVLLVSALTSIGALDEARKETEAVISGPAPPDPWRQYRSGSGRHWPRVLRDLRERVK